MITKERWDEIYTEGREYRLMNKLLLQKLLTHAPKYGKALDIGCGTGQLAYLLHKIGYETTGIDLSAVAIKQASASAEENKVDITFLQGNGEDDLPNGKFNVITSKLVIAFIDDKSKFVENIKKHLTKSGVFILVTPVTVKGEDYSDHYKHISLDETELYKLLNEHFNIRAARAEHDGYNEKSMYYVCKLPK